MISFRFLFSLWFANLLFCFLATASEVPKPEFPFQTQGFQETKQTKLDLVWGDYDRKHVGVYGSVTFTPDGNLIVSGGSDGFIRVWNVKDGTEVRSFRCGEIVEGVAVSADGKSVITSLWNNEAIPYEYSIAVWDLATGKNLKRFGGGKEQIASVELSPDGRSVLTGGNHSVRLWDLSTGTEVLKFSGKGGPVFPSFSPDGKSILAANYGDGTASLWDVASGKELRIWGDATTKGEKTYWARVSPNGKLILTVHSGAIRIWKADEPKLVRTLKTRVNKEFPWKVCFAKFSQDSKNVVCNAVWEVQTGRRILAFGPEQIFESTTLAISPDGEKVLTQAFEYFSFWDLRTGKALWPTRDLAGWWGLNDVTADGKLLLSNGKGDVRIFDHQTGAPVGTVRPLKRAFWMPSASNGKITVDKDRKGNLNVRDEVSGKILRTLAHEKVIGHLRPGKSVSPDGTKVVMEYDDRPNSDRFFLRCYHLKDGSETWPPFEISAVVTDASFSPDGKLIVTNDGTATAVLVDAETGKLVRKLTAKSGSVLGKFSPRPEDTWHSNFEFSTDSKRLLSYQADVVRLWDVTTGELIRDFRGHEGRINNARFSPDEKMLISSGWEDQTIRLWDVKTGKEIDKLNFSSSTDFGLGLTFSPDGKSFYASTGRGVVLKFSLK